jgi:dipeptidyl aminopeptidase/acylaminoacyl peptidase
MLVLQGTADVLVPEAQTEFLVGQLRTRSDDLVYITYNGADHRGVVSASFEDQLAYANAVLLR